MRDAVICEPVRTPVGRFGGVFRDVPVTALAATVDPARSMERTGLAPEDVDDVLLGQCYPNGEAPAIGRVAALDAGLPSRGARACRSTAAAARGCRRSSYGCMQVQTGAADVVLAGGAESMSQVEFYSTDVRWGVRGGGGDLRRPPRALARDRRRRAPPGAGRHARDRREPAPRLRHRARGAGRARAALAPARRRRARVGRVRRRDRRRSRCPSARRRHGRRRPRRAPARGRDRSRRWRRCEPVMRRAGPRGDGHRRQRERPERRRRAVRRDHPSAPSSSACARSRAWSSWSSAGVAPRDDGDRPGARPRAGRSNAPGSSSPTWTSSSSTRPSPRRSSPCCASGASRPDDERLNVNGSGISLGHPVGATGGRILATLLRELDRREGRYGLETMCIGGGQGLAAVFERAGQP